MKFLDVGPEPIQLKGYYSSDANRRPPGSLAPLDDVTVFYNETRKICWPYAYSVIGLLAPVATLGVTFLVARALFGPASQAALPWPDALTAHCLLVPANYSLRADIPAALRAPLEAAKMHLAISHTVLLMACAVAFLFSVQSSSNVLMIHAASKRPWLDSRWTSVPLVVLVILALGCVARWGAGAAFAPYVQRFFGALDVLAHQKCEDAALSYLAVAKTTADAFDALAKCGVDCVALAAVALALAAALLCFRFESHEVNGRWADTYVLRHKLKGLMTLFLFGSIVLVASNIALAGYADLDAVVKDGVAAAEAPAAALTTETAAAETPAGKTPVDPAETLRKTLLNVVGALASGILVAMFLPAFAGLTADIDMAGKTHAWGETHADDPAPPPRKVVVVEGDVAIAATIAAEPKPNKVAGYEMIGDWKTKHGLALEFPDVATAFAAAAAPLLSNGVFDAMKSIFGVS